MINAQLHQRPVAADRNEHRGTRMNVPLTDWRVASKLNSLFLAAVEFGDAARDFPIVFVRAGQEPDGKLIVAPIVVLGLTKDQNLYVDDAGGWRASYIPALLNCYPFCIGPMDEQHFAVCFDAAWSGIGPIGERLFDDAGEPTPFMTEATKQMERLQGESERTRVMCKRLVDADLLRDMRFDATLPDGGKLSVDGFMTVDAEKLNQAPADTVLDMHRSGLLGMVHAHHVSLGHMRRLLDWHLERQGATPKA